MTLISSSGSIGLALALLLTGRGEPLVQQRDHSTNIVSLNIAND